VLIYLLRKAGTLILPDKNQRFILINQNTMEAVEIHKSQKQDTFEGVDFLDMDDLLTEEHKLIRGSIRDFVKKEISPYIEDWAQKAHFPYEIVKKFGDVGAFGPQIPEEYGGGGLDYIAYGLIMQEIERGDSGMRSTASVQGSLLRFDRTRPWL
jgi:glutaryl-CoA dehydrogenase